jgi:imidazoleglycerol-phosphate dehydratase/histidinol-phosphatase
MKQKIAFIDRDGTIIKEPPLTFQVNSLEEMEFLPGVIHGLYTLQHVLGYELVMVTNQDGLGTPANPLDVFEKVQHKMLQILEGEGIRFAAIHIDDSYPHENKPTRKPGTALLTNYINNPNVDWSAAMVIGDRATDVALANNLGCKSVLLHSPNFPDAFLECQPDVYAQNWSEILKWLQGERKANVHRKTAETDIKVQVNLDGSGFSDIHTGLGFFDHMLEQVARHGSIDLHISVSGDLHVDEHHTIEDTAIALGEAFNIALGDKKGIERYGFLLPMDDCLAQVAIDFGGRSWLVWDAHFTREKIGEMPTEMFMHFFKSFTDAARCNLNIKADGTNEHHKIEAIFKAFARAIKAAVKRTPFDNRLPSTKGVL